MRSAYRLAVAVVVLLALPAAWHGTARAVAPGERVLVLVNRSHQDITELYISGASDGDWGPERLGDTPIATGRAMVQHLGRTRDCAFDIRVVYADGSIEERHQFDACRTRQALFDAAGAIAIGDHAVAMHNDAGRPLREIYIQSALSNGWGDDLLGDTTIPPGHDVSVTYRGSCHGDVRIVFDNDAAEERYDLDLCARAALVIVPGWAIAD